MSTTTLDSIYKKIDEWKNASTVFFWLLHYKHTHDIDMSHKAQIRYTKTSLVQLCKEIPSLPIIWSKMMSVSMGLSPLTPAEIEYLYTNSQPKGSDTTYRYWEYREMFSDLGRTNNDPHDYSCFTARPRCLGNDIPVIVHKWEDYKEQIDLWVGNTVKSEKVLFLTRVLMRCPLLTYLDNTKMVEDLHGYFTTNILARYCWLSLMIVGVKEFIPKGISQHSIECMWRTVNYQLEILTPSPDVPESVKYNYSYCFSDESRTM